MQIAGILFGTAFQISDGALELAGESAHSGSDLTKRQVTRPLLHTLRSAKRRD